MKTKLPLSILPCLFMFACAAEPGEADEYTFRNIEPVCVNDPAEANGEWTCDEPLEVECATEEIPEEIYVVLDDERRSCEDLELERIEGPFEVGTHEVIVVDAASDEAVCTTELRVVDRTPPRVVDRPIELWPPNHKMVDIEVLSCFEHVEECDDDWRARFTWASSDEPANGNGDGNTDTDIAFVSPGVVSLRAERRGGGNGRVYRLGYQIDDSSGNRFEGECRVTVQHDQGDLTAIDDGAHYVVER